MRKHFLIGWQFLLVFDLALPSPMSASFLLVVHVKSLVMLLLAVSPSECTIRQRALASQWLE